MPLNQQLLQGNAACVQGALYAGMRFYAGYPITPSTEIAEVSARELPKLGGRFIQMEDEIASIAAIVGASVSGLKAMTGTSGPGFSLMVENLGYAYMTEVPVVIVNVQRGGPSTGLPTKVSQSDTMQARWGTHGDYTAIAVAPSNVNDTFTETVRAFNLAERFRTPVTVLLDEVIGHSREIIRIPEPGELEVRDRVRPTVPPEQYVPYEMTANGVNPMPAYGEGYRYNVTGLTHDAKGFPTNRADEIKPKLDKLRFKIEHFVDEIAKLRTEYVEDAEYVYVTYGSVARTALQATKLARQAGFKVGCVQLYTVWPFPDRQLRELCGRARQVIVGELNMGQIIHEVRRVLPPDIPVHGLQRYDGEILTPMQLLEKLEEVL
ncbi:MAG TPA: 2-oxoacid:acceptor oxidoreductase subunit alpha [candidate division Zixibacteria bacterium]|nr:2-oxoacid:acceptor oxidoreductase subunit alpha [candidate division Zixibacteria bacterium]MDD4918211.1 2-oxoacid:acceptor oxidoreductase subunit alpha [candidate division Zixibacteria bacterium]MDM7973715.1 2-oxoacid:acceptor oxidoreductase subunit alpha [candidate division Zixibacteria bacterium]HOD66434.1 2-oxoacid:acceptor oxidoreductase subunit alpha [candidate division Zixibacteria bacterium]HOZ08040.1 2-oxoacid:acceptor oxidoreductase subunit alpha [candidate division Zixibacteria bac